MPSKCKLLWLHFAPYSKTFDLDLRLNWECLGFSKVPENVHKEAPNCWVTVVVHALIPGLRRQMQVVLRIWGQPSLQRGFQGSQGYKENELPHQTLLKPGIV